MINTYLRSIWDYGKDDRSLQVAMKKMLSQLMRMDAGAFTTLSKFLQEVEMKAMPEG